MEGFNPADFKNTEVKKEPEFIKPEPIKPVGILEKLCSQPEHIRKIILWAVVIVFGSGLLFFWTKSVKEKLKVFQKENLKKEFRIPSLEKELQEIPKFEMPRFSEEELKKMEEEIKALERETPSEEQQEQ